MMHSMRMIVDLFEHALQAIQAVESLDTVYGALDGARPLCAVSQHRGLTEQTRTLMQLCWSGCICGTCGSIRKPAWTPFVRPG